MSLGLRLGIVEGGRDVREARRNAPVLRGTLDSTASVYEVAGRKTSLAFDRYERRPCITPRWPILDGGGMLTC